MSDTFEILPPQELVDSFSKAVDTRRQELGFLLEHLQIGFEVVSDLDRVNAIIEASSRPDLVISEPITQIQISFPYEVGRINNFTPNMRAFGPRAWRDEKDHITNEVRVVPNGRSSPTREQLDHYFHGSAWRI